MAPLAALTLAQTGVGAGVNVSVGVAEGTRVWVGVRVKVDIKVGVGSGVTMVGSKAPGDGTVGIKVSVLVGTPVD